MSWLLFMDESGHDHRTLPYEVRGGVALHASQLWSFVQAMRRLERDSFGVELARFKKELKGCKLLDRDRYKWAAQGDPLPAADRRRHSRRFLDAERRKGNPTRRDFTAYGQASLEMARGIFRLLDEHRAVLFAAAIPRGRNVGTLPPDRLRLDHAMLLRRFAEFLRDRREHGLLVMDETEKTEDRRFVHRLHCHFMRANRTKRERRRIVPAPLFVASDMTAGVQAADLCIYAVNWGYRSAESGMTAGGDDVRQEVADEFGPLLAGLQYRPAGCIPGMEGAAGGIVFVPDPFAVGKQKKETKTEG